MRFLLSDSELVSALQSVVRHTDGRVTLDLPASKLLENASARPPLMFDASSRTVHCGSLSARLSPTQFALMQYVNERGTACFETLQDEVWGEPTTDGAIRAACSKINATLCDRGFSIELSAHHSRVSIEILG